MYETVIFHIDKMNSAGPGDQEETQLSERHHLMNFVMFNSFQFNTSRVPR
jgi:hypothetical protein